MMISKEELIDLYLNQKLAPKQIAKFIGINYKSVLRYLRIYDLRQPTVCKRPTKEKLQELFDKEFSAEKIAELFQVKIGSIFRWKEELGVSSKFDTYRNDELRKIPLSRKQREIIVGTVLGDACIALRDSGSARILLAQCNAQKDYLFWKREQLQPFTAREPIMGEKITEKGYHSIMWNCSTITHPEFREIYDLFYFDGIKQVKEHIKEYLTPLALAILYMDDGSKSKDKRITISTEGFGYEGNIVLSGLIKKNFDINCNVRPYNRRNKDYYDLGLNRENSKKFFNIVNPYMVECMRYKIVDDDIV